MVVLVYYGCVGVLWLCWCIMVVLVYYGCVGVLWLCWCIMVVLQTFRKPRKRKSGHKTNRIALTLQYFLHCV